MGLHELAVVGLTGSGLGAALGVPMVWPRSARSLDARLFGFALLLMSAIAALISARLAGLVPASAEVDHAVNLLGMCAGAFLVLYTRYATAAPVTRGITLSTLLPAGVYLVVVIVRMLAGAGGPLPFAWVLPVVLGFTATCAATLWRYGGSRRSGLVPAEWLLAFVVALNVAQVVRMELGHIPLVRAIVPAMLAVGFLAATAYLAWRAVSPPASSPGSPDTIKPPRYERSGLEESRAPELLRRIDTALTKDRLFSRAGLTLTQLATAADCTPHQVSEALNRYAGVSFHDFINRRRVEDVKAQLTDPSNDQFTIEGIGASAGFKSRSALYSAFRRFEDTTPNAYRASRRRVADE
jgi:AraC-like DNA-binding protein